MRSIGRWTAGSIMLASSLIWMWAGHAIPANRIIEAALIIVNVAIGFGAGFWFDHTRELSFRDDLTQAYNRRFLWRRMPAVLSRTSKRGEVLSLMLVDCDDFKKINDEYGHNTGDTVLRGISQLMIKNMRRDDFVVRWGGDEFLLIAGGVDKRSFLNLAKHLDNKLKDMSDQMNMDLSVSIGSAFYPEDARELEDLIRIADQRMYDDKKKR